MFGVVNVVTRTGREVNGTELAASWQQPQAQQEGRATFGKLLDNGVDLVLSASGLYAKGEDRFFDYGSSGVSGVAADMDGRRAQQFFASIRRGAWAFDLIDGNHIKYDPTGAYRSTPLVTGQYQSDHYTLLQGQYEERFLDDTLQMLARVFAGQEKYTSELDYGTRFSYPATSQWRGFEVRGLYTKLADHKLMLGMELTEGTRVEQQILDLATPANNVLISSAVMRTGVYAQDEWKLAPTVTATLGLRWDKDASNNISSSPRAALIWQATSDTTLKTLYGRAFRAPNAYERDYTDTQAQVGNPALATESIETLELVADHRVRNDLGVRASVYQWNMVNIITLGIDPVSGLSQYQSGRPVNAQGLELSADKTWPEGSRLRGSVSFQQVRTDSGSGFVNSPRQLAKLNYSTLLPWARLRLGYELRYDSQRLSLDGSDLGSYVVSNVYLSTDKWVKGLELGLGILNLFNQPYSQPGADTNWQNALEQDGRSVRLKATYRF